MTDSNQTNGQSHVADDRPIGVPLRQGGDGPEAPKADTKVDLAAWGRGQKNYLFHEVQAAIDDLIFDRLYETLVARRGIVRDPAGAVDWLVEEGIIQPEEARTDV
jgi:hypothetical protein